MVTLSADVSRETISRKVVIPAKAGNQGSGENRDPIFLIPILSESSSMVLIFSEKEELHSTIHEINVLAFGGKNGAKPVENLWESPSFIAQLSFLTVVLSCPDPCALPVGRDTVTLFSSVSRET